MWAQRSFVVMHGTSFPGVSFTQLSHPDADCAFAVAGRQSTAAAQSAGSHHCLTRCGMSNPPQRWTLRRCYVSVTRDVKPSRVIDATHLSDIVGTPSAAVADDSILAVSL